ncbi:hypothetical protein ABW20_dc0109446 [Dactylellina cionopaga]|nr:hypothetical protein ABW20_dc0109446 [Dactylellina cionopaga]
MTDAHSTKKAKLEPKYELIYWPGVPGRGEYVRLALEAAGVPYQDTSNESKDGVKRVLALVGKADVGGETPALAPPALHIPSSNLTISQTPNILLYLGEHDGLAPSDDSKYLVHQYALTALDLNNESHNTHHPVSVAATYEDQKTEALRHSVEFRAARIPKFFTNFDRIVRFNASKFPGTKFLVGETLTYADTTLWHVINGVSFAFPKKVEQLRGDEGYKALFAWYDTLKEEAWLKEYLESNRRLPYSKGIFRYYAELDVDQ